ncbi:ABC-type multidrug transport system, ATPase component [Anaerolinea thermolimosa]|uniref:ABC transporter ATP-binding protein n=1 Tax=Anaerolinea thermolimosa TaxID=229919 RepID=UPI0007807EEA|nr:ABC transporter ATP-binding protein [Anaerolinea thermolimosa]GAP06349.1 ABC-type multidrug transport system, ATPase component [Anaerolinea thermolimosa]
MELKIEKLSKSFGTRFALKNVNLELTSGCVAVFGPNGSGKTTLLRCLATVLRPDNGHLWFDKLSYARNMQSIRSQVGYLPQELHFPNYLSGRQILNYLAALKESCTAEQIEDLLITLGLQKISNKPLSSLSHGEMRLIGIAQALLGKPRLILLDEPIRGLDVKERDRVFSLLRRNQQGRLILYTTHDVEDITRIADRVILLFGGEVVFYGAVTDLYFSAQNGKEGHNKPASIAWFLNAVVPDIRNGDSVRFE